MRCGVRLGKVGERREGVVEEERGFYGYRVGFMLTRI